MMTAQKKVRVLLMSSAAMLLACKGYAQETIVLDPINVESKREVQTDTATAETIVDLEEIEDRQADTIAELIDTVPGVTLVNGGSPVGSGINIRGFGANGIYGTDQKVGVQIGGASTGAEELYRLGTQLFTDPLLYREVAVLRGMGGTVEYASGLFGGLVLLEPIQASDVTGGVPGTYLRQTLQFSTNGDGITSSTIGAWQPTDNLEMLFNYTWRQDQVPTDARGDALRTKGTTLPSWLINTRYTFGDADQHQIGLLLSNTNTDQYDVPYDEWNTTGDSFGNVDRQTDNSVAVLRYEFDSQDNDFVNLQVDLSYSDETIDQQYVPGSSPLEGTPSWPFLEPLVNADHRYKTTKLLIKNNAFFSTGGAQHDLRFGFEVLNKKRADNAVASAPGGTDRRYALFAIDDIDVNDRLTLTPQLRYEMQKIDGDGYPSYDNNATMGGLAIRYAFGNGFAATGGLYYNESLPILDDLTNPTFMTQSEKATTYEAGLSYVGYDVIADGDALAVKAVAYSTHIWDITSYSGVTNAELKGLEIEAAYSMASGFYVDLNANIARGDNTTTGTTNPYWRGTPADVVRLTVGKVFDEQLDVSWEMVAAARKTRVNPGDDEVGGYGVHNLRAVYRPQDGVLAGTELWLGIENIFDKQYKTALSTRPAYGRNIKFTIAKTF